jgi:hypothetical protein
MSKPPGNACRLPIALAAISQLILLRDALVTKRPEQLVEPINHRPMSEDDLLCV